VGLPHFGGLHNAFQRSVPPKRVFGGRQDVLDVPGVDGVFKFQVEFLNITKVSRSVSALLLLFPGVADPSKIPTKHEQQSRGPRVEQCTSPTNFVLMPLISLLVLLATPIRKTETLYHNCIHSRQFNGPHRRHDNSSHPFWYRSRAPYLSRISISSILNFACLHKAVQQVCNIREVASFCSGGCTEGTTCIDIVVSDLRLVMATGK